MRPVRPLPHTCRPRLVNLYGAFLDGYKLLIWLYLLECAVYGLWMNRDSAGLVLAGCLTMGAAMVSNLLDNNQFEPVYTGWQTEYSGFILVIIFWILTVRHISRVLKQKLVSLSGRTVPGCSG